MLTGGGARHDDTGIRPDDGIDGFIMCDFKGGVRAATYLIYLSRGRI